MRTFNGGSSDDANELETMKLEADHYPEVMQRVHERIGHDEEQVAGQWKIRPLLAVDIRLEPQRQ
jgi:molybdopterin synthase catalytic subunit